MNLVEQARDLAVRLFKDKLSSLYTYHNLNHTIDVVAAVDLLVGSQHIDPSDREILLLAAWFHDTGYINVYDNHEESSVVIATDFLKEKGKSADYIDKVAALIRATAYDYVPKTAVEKIIRDADYYHISSGDYAASSNALRLEWHYLCQKTYSDADWINENLDFLTNRHRYYTDFALENWQPLKDKTIKSLLKKKNKMELHNNTEFDKELKKREKKEKPGRAIDTLFRITLNNHTSLSGIADSKANILLSVNAIRRIQVINAT